MTDEARRPGHLPLWDVPGWRERYGVSAGITGRATAAGAPFDLGLWTARPVHDVMSDWRAFRTAQAEFPAQVMSHQIHGTTTRWHRDDTGWSVFEGLDGHGTATPGLLLMVTVADCVPVYLLAPQQRAIALLHAGWRGTAGGILERGVDLLTQGGGCTAGDLVMHCGVSISGPCYEVGREVMEGVGAAADGSGPWHLDLRANLAARGRALGIPEVTVSGHCTARQAGEFHSHRRSGGVDGRMVAWLGLLP